MTKIKRMEVIAKACKDTPTEWYANYRRFRFEDETFAIFVLRTLEAEADEHEDVL